MEPLASTTVEVSSSVPAATMLPRGTRPSAHNGQLLVSTGLLELDGEYEEEEEDDDEGRGYLID